MKVHQGRNLDCLTILALIQHVHKRQPQIRPRFESADCSGSDESNHNERASLRLNPRLGCKIYEKVEVLGTVIGWERLHKGTVPQKFQWNHVRFPHSWTTQRHDAV